MKIAILHGTKGSPDGNWFPWLAKALRERGNEVLIPALPTPAGQSLEGWLGAFDAQVGPLESIDALIGHSAGALFALRLLERARTPVRCCALVAGLTGVLGIPEYDSLNATFVERSLDWKKIRSGAKKFLVLAGEGDPYVPKVQNEHIAQNLGVELISVADGGHLNAEFGFTSFPLLLKTLDATLIE